ncbi:hypothetical protein [Gynuella sunshinyii]|uniref:Uncharacterized protein n=1 Tax=Gynuella sunshinyii YC6258 TaxID=1445510 RepID=A0A0C5VQY6_9GAMM|nr:hypothetical protein [Gynuella sunshinyii]AJQ92250.1 hypothetical Protein YC6258_00198 [Gynuella sunshinyii YC6258]AJQ95803.1 hypothetical Protein YC6258_03767 [Gynuella sunshinyii YC6258]
MKAIYVAAGAAALAMISVGGYVGFEKIRGIRNRNPLNIRKSDIAWDGKVYPGSDSDFEQFESTEYGIRAAYKLMMTYRNKYGLDTVAGIVGRWAPGNENDTGAYIDSVCQSMGVRSDYVLPINRYPDLIAAMIKHENGINPYSADVIHMGVNLA